jgi:hypothetical protein
VHDLLRGNLSELFRANPRDVDLGDAHDLASSGKLDAAVEVVLTGSGQQAWVYGSGIYRRDLHQ